MTYGEYIPKSTTVTKWGYHLNGNANDFSGNGLNGTATNITWVGGRLGGGGAGISGASNSYIDIPNTAHFPIVGTLVCNFKWDDFTTGSNGNLLEMISKRDPSASNGAFFLLYGNSSYSTPNILWLAIYDGAYKSKIIPIVLTAGVWYNIIIMYNFSSAGQTTFMVNGKLYSPTTDNTSSTFSTNSSTVRIGYSANGLISFKGTSDEVFVENVKWSISEARNYYNQIQGFMKPKMINF